MEWNGMKNCSFRDARTAGEEKGEPVGDIHLAMFRVSKMVVDVSGDTNGAEQEAETAQVSTATQQTN
uniref:Uncharacterized protein n=1 Tax=Oryza barthii TaxID=65489 RepID=A0A0D3HQV5_9ORYZ